VTNGILTNAAALNLLMGCRGESLKQGRWAWMCQNLPLVLAKEWMEF
jgi:hypothetical protein